MLNLHISHSENMLACGRILAQSTGKNAVVFLQGSLGAGKTTLVRGFLEGLGYLGSVKSPTYTLVETYILPDTVVLHWDLYRLVDPEDLELLGIRDYLEQPAWWFVEWPERFKDILPAPDLLIDFTIKGTERELSLQEYTEQGSELVRLFGILQKN